MLATRFVFVLSTLAIACQTASDAPAADANGATTLDAATRNPAEASDHGASPPAPPPPDAEVPPPPDAAPVPPPPDAAERPADSAWRVGTESSGGPPDTLQTYQQVGLPEFTMDPAGLACTSVPDPRPMPRPDQHPDCEIRPPENPPADFVPGPNVTLLHFETANRSRFWRWDARAHLERDERFLHTDDDIDRCQQVEVDLCIRNPADQLVWAGWAFDDSCDGVVVQGDSQLTHFDYDPDGRIVRWIGMARDIFVPASGDSASIYEVWFDDDGRVAVYAAWSCFEVGIGFELPTPSSGNCAQMEVGRFLYRPDGSVRAEESGFNGVLSQRTLYGEPCPEPIAGPDAGLADAAVGAGDLGARR